MKIIIIPLLIGLLSVTTTAKPTFDVIADIIHDLVHDPNQPSYHKPPPQYVHNGAYTQSAYHQPGYTQGGYAYNQRPHVGGRYPPNNGYYTNNQQVGYYPPTGPEGYGPNAVYDNQGYYKGPPYPAHQTNGYIYNNGYSNSGSHYGYKHRGY